MEIIRYAGLALWLLLVTGCGTVSSNELPKYTVVETYPEAIEIREYPPMVLAEVTVEGDRSEAANKAFRILADYIFGNNVAREEIAMTAPVTQKPIEQSSVEIEMTAPVTQKPVDESNESWDVAFMMPARFTLETLPEAKNERIRFRETEPRRVAAIRFSGSWSQKLFDDKRSILEAFLKEQGLAFGEYEYAFYNAPFTPPPLRRNEVLIELRK